MMFHNIKNQKNLHHTKITLTIIYGIPFHACTVPEQGCSDKADIERAKKVQERFITMLRNYIRRNALKQTILQQMTAIWVCV